MSNETVLPKRGRGRPTKAEQEARAKLETQANPDMQQKTAEVRRKRVPVSGNRDLLTVLGKDPNYHYRWVIDGDERGQRLWKFTRAGYEHVKSSEVEIGEDMVFKSDNVGSIVRYPAGNGTYLYLMKIPREWYQEDQKIKEQTIEEEEVNSLRERDLVKDDGMYGGGKLSRGRTTI